MIKRDSRSQKERGWSKTCNSSCLDNIIVQTSFAFAFVSETNSDSPAEGKKVSLSTS